MFRPLSGGDIEIQIQIAEQKQTTQYYTFTHHQEMKSVKSDCRSHSLKKKNKIDNES